MRIFSGISSFVYSSLWLVVLALAASRFAIKLSLPRQKREVKSLFSAVAGLKRLCASPSFFSINLFTVKCVMFAFTIVVYLAIKEISFRVFYWLFLSFRFYDLSFELSKQKSTQNIEFCMWFMLALLNLNKFFFCRRGFWELRLCLKQLLRSETSIRGDKNRFLSSFL